MEGLVSYLKYQINGKKQADFAVGNIHLFFFAGGEGCNNGKRKLACMLRSDFNLKIYGKSI